MYNILILKTIIATSLVISISLLVVEVVDMWITSKTARAKKEVQKRKVEQTRWPLHSKTKTLQGFTYKHIKEQVRKNRGCRRGLEHEERTIFNVDNLWITCG